jgi:hypothetical protein
LQHLAQLGPNVLIDFQSVASLEELADLAGMSEHPALQHVTVVMAKVEVVMAKVVMAKVVMAKVVMAKVVMAKVVMAKVVMAKVVIAKVVIAINNIIFVSTINWTI